MKLLKSLKSLKSPQLLQVCPDCGVISPFDERYCDCGHDFYLFGLCSRRTFFRAVLVLLILAVLFLIYCYFAERSLVNAAIQEIQRLMRA
jgi:hypothetical protein